MLLVAGPAPDRNAMKIAFRLLGVDGWPAGHVYIRNMLRGVREAGAKDVEVCLLVREGEQKAIAGLRDLIDDVVVCPRFRRWTPLWALAGGARMLLELDVFEELRLRRRGVTLTAFGYAPGSRRPQLPFIPDFQHRQLPEMFSRKECQTRDRWFSKIAEGAVRILLLSESVRRDFLAFAPQHAAKGRVVYPVGHVPPSVYERAPEPICGVYGLPEKFVYLPNQFWKHKNHRVAFQAVRLLKESGVDVFLACSGYLGDYRDPRYVPGLLEEISRSGARDRVVLLGVVPREHVFMLMRQSVCVLNPSLFEGYGMTVDEARSLGKQLVASDIACHREQDPPQAVFFDPRDPEDLATKLEKVWRDKSPGPDDALEREARESLPRRLRESGESFLSVVREVLAA